MHHQQDPGRDTTDDGALRWEYDLCLKHIGNTPADGDPGYRAVAGDLVFPAR